MRTTEPTGVDQFTYRRAIGHFATGVAVVTVADDGDGPHGMTANAVASVSLSPVLLAVAHPRSPASRSCRDAPLAEARAEVQQRVVLRPVVGSRRPRPRS
jgi:flavin reductase (DIM6/NTAB) family NADH-FMN oxidoreductase RutF